MAELFLVKEDDICTWERELNYNLPCDPKGQSAYDGVNYIDSRRILECPPPRALRYEFGKQTTIAEIVNAFVGHDPRHYTASDLDQLQWSVSSHQSEVRETCLRLMAAQENWSVRSVEQIHEGKDTDCVSTNQTVVDAGFADGDVMVLRHLALQTLLKDAARIIAEQNLRFSISLCRDATQFLEAVGSITSDSSAPSVSHSFEHLLRWHPERPLVGLLYTDEDTHLASYVRYHYDALDRASGEHCDVIVLERKSALLGAPYWRSLLDHSTYIAWRLLRWTEAHPFNKNDTYRIADELGISYAMIPCMILFRGRGPQIAETIPFGNDLTSDFRTLFSRYQSKSFRDSLRSVTHVPQGFIRRIWTKTFGTHKPSSASTKAQLSQCSPDPAADRSTQYHVNERERSCCFLSYSSKDRPLVRRVATVLQSCGVGLWFDEWNIRPGDQIVNKIAEGLSKANVVVIFLSKDSVDSRWVNEEWTNMLHKTLTTGHGILIPVVLDDCKVPMMLQTRHCVRAGVDAKKIAAQLLSAISRQVSSDAET